MCIYKNDTLTYIISLRLCRYHSKSETHAKTRRFDKIYIGNSRPTVPQYIRASTTQHYRNYHGIIQDIQYCIRANGYKRSVVDKLLKYHSNKKTDWKKRSNAKSMYFHMHRERHNIQTNHSIPQRETKHNSLNWQQNKLRIKNISHEWSL